MSASTPIQAGLPSAVDPDAYAQAILNVLVDFGEEKALLEDMQRAALNILEDSESDKTWLLASQRAALNILDDSQSDKGQLDAAQRAILNVLDDSEADKTQLQDLQRALLNILEDVDTERNERSLAEAQVRVLNEGLEARVAQRTGELTAANEELETFAYSVSHDLRTPLRAIDGFSGILSDDYADKLDAEGRRIIGVVRDGTRRMAELIDGILAFSRVSRSEMGTNPVDMNEVVRDLLRELAPAIGTRNVRFAISAIPPAQGDRLMLRRVWQNLLDNAIKYTSTCDAALIEVGSEPGAAEVAYYVRDNGVGFDMRYVSKLFGMFQRLHGPAEFSGTGIGLAIVKRIIARHGGRVWADGQLRQGSTFHFTLPIGHVKHD